MPSYLLLHQHAADECRFAYAAWRGFSSPLRQREALSSCLLGDHRIVWTGVAADSAEGALALLPPYVADRTEVDCVRPVPIP